MRDKSDDKKQSSPQVVARAPDRRSGRFNPWRYGAVTIPPELRREIVLAELPLESEDRLYSGAPPAPDDSECERPAARRAVGRNVTRWVLAVSGAVIVLALAWEWHAPTQRQDVNPKIDTTREGSEKPVRHDPAPPNGAHSEASEAPDAPRTSRAPRTDDSVRAAPNVASSTPRTSRVAPLREPAPPRSPVPKASATKEDGRLIETPPATKRPGPDFETPFMPE
jgi:hypothetical protein